MDWLFCSNKMDELVRINQLSDSPPKLLNTEWSTAFEECFNMFQKII